MVFSGSQLYEFFEAEKIDYVAGMAKNPVLETLAEPLMAEVRADFEALQQTTHRYTECAYRAGSWSHERRVVIKAEVAAHFGSARRGVIHLPIGAPFADDWWRIARSAPS